MSGRRGAPPMLPNGHPPPVSGRSMHVAVPAEHVPRPVVRSPEPWIGHQVPLGGCERQGRRFRLEMPVEPGSKLRGAIVLDLPERRHHVAGTGVEKGARKGGIVLSWSEVSGPAGSQPGFTPGQEDERAGELSRENLVHLELAIAVPGSAP